MKFEELLANAEFNQQVAAAKDAQEIIELFAAKGIDVPMEIAQELFEQPTDAELSADDLDNVAGGAFWGAVVGGGAAYICYRLSGRGKKEAVSAALKHGRYGYNNLSW